MDRRDRLKLKIKAVVALESDRLRWVQSMVPHPSPQKLRVYVWVILGASGLQLVLKRGNHPKKREFYIFGQLPLSDTTEMHDIASWTLVWCRDRSCWACAVGIEKMAGLKLQAKQNIVLTKFLQNAGTAKTRAY